MISRFPLLIVLTGVSLAFGSPRSGNAADVRIPVASAPNYAMFELHSVSDGAGGAIFGWIKYPLALTGELPQIFVHHVLASDAVDPAWPVNGLRLTTDGSEPYLVSDGHGGAIVVWMRESSLDIYATHVLASGVVDPAWPSGGCAIAVVPGNQIVPRAISDGAGGAIVTWGDNRSGWNIYAHHVLASGVVDPAWPVNGRRVSMQGEDLVAPIVASGADGAIIVWGGAGIYAQRIQIDGTFDPAWPPNGKVVSPSSQESPRAVSDGSGGAVITSGVYAMRVLSSGNLAPGWPPQGVALGTGTGQTPTGIAADGTGGAVIAWGNGTSIHAARVTGSGTVPWTPNGVPIAVGGPKAFPDIVSDGLGGYFITWQDHGATYSSCIDVFAHHLLGSGAVDPEWPENGRAISTGQSTHPAQGHEPILIASGSGGAILGWNESLIPYCTKPDIFAMHLFAPQVACAEVSFDLDPDTFNLKSMGRWVTGAIYSPPPLSAADIDIASIRLDGSVAVDPSAPVSISGDTLIVKFDRAALELKLEEGDSVTVTVSGQIGGTCFEGSDVVRVKRGHVSSPAAGSEVQAGSTTEVAWSTPPGIEVQSVAVLASVDGGQTWDLVDHDLPNSGSYPWTAPLTSTANARIAVVLVEGAASEYEVTGVLGTSGTFTVAQTLDVGVAGSRLALYGAIPNPSRGLAVSLSLPDGAPASLAVYDVGGRVVRTQSLKTLAPGRHVVTIAVPGTLAPGVYLVHLTQGDRRLMVRAAVVR
jgi:hypothetical protein